METQVILCDKCKNIVAKTKCIICGIDLCPSCATLMRFRINDKTLSDNIPVCYTHYIKIEDITRKVNINDLLPLQDTLLEQIKKLMILVELKEANEKEIRSRLQ